MKTTLCLSALALSALSLTAQAQIRISEWLYNTQEFIELTNIGSVAIDMTNWSYSDSARIVDQVSLSAFGLVLPGESVILSEAAASSFRSTWGLSASVDVIGGNSANLGRGDEINIYDANDVLVDRLTYGDQVFAGTIRTETRSGNPINLAVLENDTVGAPGDWVFATAGDSYGSISAGGAVANPGTFALVPEPSTALLLGVAGLALAARRRRA